VAMYVNNLKTHSTEYVNQFGLDLVGFSQENLAVKGFNWQSERLHPDDSEFVNEQIKCILRGECFSEIFLFRLTK
jgi:hypothetical protein